MSGRATFTAETSRMTISCARESRTSNAAPVLLRGRFGADTGEATGGRCERGLCMEGSKSKVRHCLSELGNQTVLSDFKSMQSENPVRYPFLDAEIGPHPLYPGGVW